MNTKKKFTKVMMFVLVFTIIASSTFTAFGAAGKWIKSGNRWWYRHNDSSYTTNDWEKINNKWYHFDSKGWMQTGWLKVSGKWYYLNPNGDMATGWKKVKGDWYYLNSNGAMATGWKKVKNVWYFLDEESGAMLYDELLYDNDNYYYLKSNGAMAIGWTSIYGDSYYFYKSGAMAYNTWIGDYYVNFDGMWIEDTNIYLDDSYESLGIGYVNSADYENFTVRETADPEVISQFVAYISQLEPTVKQNVMETESSIYDAIFFRSVENEDYDEVMILEEDEVLIYYGTMYDIDMEQVKTIWDLCTEVPLEDIPA